MGSQFMMSTCPVRPYSLWRDINFIQAQMPTGMRHRDAASCDWGSVDFHTEAVVAGGHPDGRLLQACHIYYAKGSEQGCWVWALARFTRVVQNHRQPLAGYTHKIQVSSISTKQSTLQLWPRFQSWVLFCLAHNALITKALQRIVLPR